MKRELYLLFVGGEFFGLFADPKSAHERGGGFLPGSYCVVPRKLSLHEAEQTVQGDLSYCWNQQLGMMLGA